MNVANDFIKTFPWIDGTIKVGTGSGKIHLWARCHELPNNVTKWVKKFENGHIELRANGHFVVAPFSVHPSGHQYCFVDPKIQIPGISKLIREISKEELDQILCWFKAESVRKECEEGQAFFNDARIKSAEYFFTRALGNARLHTRNDIAFWFACQLRDLGFSQMEVGSWGEKFVSAIPQDGHPFTLKEFVRVVESAFQRRPRSSAFKKELEVDRKQDLELKLLAHPLTDAGNAESFVTLFGRDFCYVHESGKWFKFDKIRWKQDESSVRLSMLETVRYRRKIAESIQDDKLRKEWILWSLSSESIGRVNAAITFAESMLVEDLNKFDRDPYLLCCSNGVVNLLSGELNFARPEDKLRCSTGVNFDPYAICPQWINFIREIFQGDEELIHFIQKAIGYTLTGDTSEQCLFIFYGTGANGKSTFLGIVEKIMGEYGLTIPSSTLKERHGDDYIPNDIARMAGARFVKCIEVKERANLNEERIKSLTGGDKITARFLHQEYFDFVPTHKLWIAVNHKPTIKGNDIAIWRRIRLIPFEVTFSPEKQDKHLSQKLHSELSGILKWAIQGCLEWKKNGLEPPEKVRVATKTYQEESDLLGRFLAERTAYDNDGEVRASELYKAYEEWCEEVGERPVSGTAFGRGLIERGLQKYKTQYVIYRGVKLV
jgi:putative DNA primase/helicase